MHPVTIETFPARRFVALPHRGAYAAIGATFDRLVAELGRQNLWPRVCGPMAAFHYDDRATVPVTDQRAHAGVALEGPLPHGFAVVEQAGGRAAVLTLKGSYAGIPAAWSWLCGTWLPRSGEDPGDAAAWEEYPNMPMNTAEADLITRICVPLKG